MSQQKLKSQEDKFKQIFQALDASGDGVLTIQELRKGLKEQFGSEVDDQTCCEMFMGIDTSGDKKCSCDEFVKEMCKGPRKEAFQEEFKNADGDGSGKLDRSELKRLCQKVGATGVDDDFLEKLLDSADKDGNGVIDYEEFMALC